METIVKKLGSELEKDTIIEAFLQEQLGEKRKEIEWEKKKFEEAIMEEVYAFLKKRKRASEYFNRKVSRFPSIPNPANQGKPNKTLLEFFKEVVSRGVEREKAFFSFPRRGRNSKDFGDFLDLLKKIGLQPDPPIGHEYPVLYFDMEFQYAKGEDQVDYAPYQLFFRSQEIKV